MKLSMLCRAEREAPREQRPRLAEPRTAAGRGLGDDLLARMIRNNLCGTLTLQRAVLHVGEEDWPFPIPIVRRGKGWLFDTPAAANEILNRRIGRNELNAIQVCLASVDAQWEYASVDRDGSGVRAFARSFLSTAGKEDGLYWPTQQEEEASPLGPLVARAAEEGYPTPKGAGKPVPYQGYFY